jgi:hypothetical protein
MEVIVLLGIALSVLFALVILLWAFHKVRRAHLLLYELRSEHEKDLTTLFNQLEALHGLYLELKFPVSLPPTRAWAASPDFLLLIAQHALDSKPEVIVECGSGVSTLVLARCMQLKGSGHVYSLEHDSEFTQKTRQHLERHELSKWATVFHAPLYGHHLHGEQWPWYSEEVLPKLPIDMLVIDGPPYTVRSLARYPAGPILFNRLNDFAVVFVDDTNREDERKILGMWASEFPELDQQLAECEKGCTIIWKKGKTFKESI